MRRERKNRRARRWDPLDSSRKDAGPVPYIGSASLQDRFGANWGWLVERYQQYRDDPGSLTDEDRRWFDQHGAAVAAELAGAPAATAGPSPATGAAISAVLDVRRNGHRRAVFDPLTPPAERPSALAPDEAAVLVDDVNRGLDAPLPGGGTMAEAWPVLHAIYMDRVGYEFSHVDDADERRWLHEAVETGRYAQPLAPAEQRILLHRLIQVEAFERFLHTTFPGQKRFSIEGTDMLVPMLDEAVRLAAAAGAEDVVLGMAHRGRLNVLAHVLGKPYRTILEEFHAAPVGVTEGSETLSTGWVGDVKYHLGRQRTLPPNGNGQATVRVTLANNPSHLEFVNPVVEGLTRAAQEQVNAPGAPVQHPDRAVAVLVHGDAAFPGEGVTAETLNLARLAGFSTGGTLHLIANNALGFTTDPHDGRSTRYASDLAKGFDIPVVHVSADEPGDCIAAIRLAHAYRQRFHHDFLIDLVGYRRYGHNEGDDPVYTQPKLYELITKHPRVREIWQERLTQSAVVTAAEATALMEAATAEVRAAYDRARSGAPADAADRDEPAVVMAAGRPPVETAVPEPRLRAIHGHLFAAPDGFHVYPKLDRGVDRWREALDKPGAVDWALGEWLAFATLLADGVPVRLTGQDTERGTFSHRQGVWHDVDTGAVYRPLQHLPEARAAFSLYNSPLSEAAVVGFEYGYSVRRPEALTLWEAQFGDFVNAAQVHLDQFLAAGQSKWRQTASLVLLLPHAYEGQGAEHSSARLERFLQLSAGENWTVAYPTTAAQYFHLLRRQALSAAAAPRPLVVMTPKSLLRNPVAGSSLEDLTTGGYQPVLAKVTPKRTRAVVLATGKVTTDLMAAVQDAHADGVLVLALEDLYPWPGAALRQALRGVPDTVPVAWVQEEPENMGAWWYARPRLQELVGSRSISYIGRPARSSPAEGDPDMHQAEQRRILREALALADDAPRAASQAKGGRHGH